MKPGDLRVSPAKRPVPPSDLAFFEGAVEAFELGPWLNSTTFLSHVKQNRATDKSCQRLFNFGMDKQTPDDYLRANLAKLIALSDPGGKTSIRKWAMGHKLEPRNIQRIMNGDQSPTLTSLQEIGKAVGLEVWQLILPNLDPRNPPVITMTETERVLYKKLRQQVAELPDI